MSADQLCEIANRVDDVVSVRKARVAVLIVCFAGAHLNGFESRIRGHPDIARPIVPDHDDPPEAVPASRRGDRKFSEIDARLAEHLRRRARLDTVLTPASLVFDGVNRFGSPPADPVTGIARR